MTVATVATVATPVNIGRCTLQHRVVMAPMTRLRADENHVPLDMMLEYYSQRASIPGTLLITEATFVSEKSRGRDENAPGIYSEEQVDAWKKITDEVHAKGSFIFMQLWHVGRAARQHALDKAGLEMVSSSDIPIADDHPTPRPMTADEIWECIGSFASAAKNAVNAGFDGVEIHAANGYLIDQFTQDTCNKRTDEWGGSIEKRSRFCLEVARVVSKEIGADRTSIRLSPFSTFQAMRMDDPKPQFTHLISELNPLGLAYLHLIEPRIAGNVERMVDEDKESLDFAFDAWARSAPVIVAGGYTAETASHALETRFRDDTVAFAFGRHFISNPDLPFRLAKDIALAKYDRDTFYKVRSRDGYTDYSFSEAWIEGQRL
ncbi:putative nADPh2 dehydrogenase chain oye2 [Fusarium flagelliforme]|uniref:Putative nADPh2 dehydrogenase chain oye2 n=2 Tax=Fusarium flagelliforme TaxID=2675880 RepID=A0A395MM69_9HYPO|nr:putative nADPh2 dehydrogenase chain oye2 [Fusarium flagelliforme]